MRSLIKVKQVESLLVLSVLIFVTIDCKPIRGVNSEESYHPYHDYYRRYEDFHHEPEPIKHHSSNNYHRRLAATHPKPDMIPLDSQGSDDYGLFPYPHEIEQQPPFNPNILSMALGNPFTKVIEDGRKQVEQSMQQMADNVNKQMTDAAKKQAEEMGKQMKDMMNLPEAGTELPLPSPSGVSPAPGLPELRKDSMKKEQKEDKEKDEKKDEKEKPAEGDNPMKKLADAGSEMVKKIPENMPLPVNPIKLMGRFHRIWDETTEAHDDYYDGPRVERREFAAPELADISYHPNSDYFDYYDSSY